MKKALILFASPRKDGQSSVLLNSFLEAWPGEHTRIDAYSKKIKPCIDCRACWRSDTPHCAINDDMQEIYKQIDESDCFVLISPVFFCGMPAPMKTIIDRCQCYWAHNHLHGAKSIREGRKAAAILVGGAKSYPGQFENILCGYRHWLDDQKTELIGTVTMSNSDSRNAKTEPALWVECRELALSMASAL